MKITRIQFIHSSQLFVKLETDEGITGYGEGGKLSPMAAAAGLELAEISLLGEDPRNIDRLWQRNYRQLPTYGGQGGEAAVAAIDMALWDIKGKTAGVPVYQLLGGLARDKVRLYAHVEGQSELEITRNVEEHAEAGITALCYRMGRHLDTLGATNPQFALKKELETLEVIRRIVGWEAELLLDFDCRYEPVYAAELAKEAESFRPALIMDPHRQESPQALERLRSCSDLPLAIGAKGRSKWDFREVLERGLVDYICPDIRRCGGISEMRKLAALAEIPYVSLVPRNPGGFTSTLASLHLSLAVPNLAMMELPSEEGKISSSLASRTIIENGYALPPEKPGLGIEFDEEITIALGNQR